MEENTYKIRKEKVKNISIVFLVILLILTFFSNSILNRSLPEVATSYVERGTITEKVRGNGIVEAEDPYKIVATAGRTIASVPVKEGDLVVKDQVLFELEDKDSEELKTAEKELDEMIQAYTTALLNGEISNESFNTIQSGHKDSVVAYQAQIEAARQKVKACEAVIEGIKRQQLLNSNADKLESTDPVNLEEAISKKVAAAAAVEEAKAAIATAKDNLSKVLIIDGKQWTIDGLKTEQKNLRNILASPEYQPAYFDKKKDLIGKFDGKPETKILIQKMFAEDEWQLLTDENNRDAILRQIGELEDSDKTAANELYKAIFEDTSLEGDTLYNQYKKLAGNIQKYQDAIDQYPLLQMEVSSASERYGEAQADYEHWTSKVSELTGEKNESIQSENDLAVSLADAEAALEKAKNEQAQLLTDIGKELDLFNQNSIMADKQKEIAELRKKSVGATIVSPVDGMILSVTKTAGEETAIDEELATIQVAGKDMILSFPVTKEQASKVRVGDKASIQNSWYYENVEVTLSRIKPDKDNPAKNKLLEFKVTGDVQNGESLGVELGQRSKDYDHVVPNSAVREDKKGKFILIIQEKTTPFGNRYKAKRYNVEVLASDETNSAIGVEGELNDYEYVITTSNIPVENGSQVRLAEY